MFKRFAALAAVVVVCSLAMGQEKPWAAEYDKGVGTAVFQAVSIDQAWSGAVKVLMQSKLRIRSSEKSSGTLVAERREVASYQYALTLYFEVARESVKITASCDALDKGNGLDGMLLKVGRNKSNEKVEAKFFGKLAAEFYK